MFICVLWRGGAHELGPVCVVRFRPSIFCTANETLLTLARGVGRGFTPGLERAIDEAGGV